MPTDTAGPAVSCLCASVPSRWGLLQRAITDYAAQTYPEKELVVVVNDANYASTVRAWVYAQLGDRPDVKVYDRVFRQHNEAVLHAMAKAAGPYLAAWDDDNLNLPDRLAVQMGYQRGLPKTLTALEDALYLFHETAELYAVNFQNPAGKPAERCAPTTLVGHRDLWPEPKATHRPAAWSAMLNEFASRGVGVTLLGGMWASHLVGVRGDNLRGGNAHRALVAKSPNTRKAAWLAAVRPQLETAVAAYPFDAGVRLTVHGADAIAYELAPTRHWPADLYAVGEPADDGVVRVTETING